LNSTDWNDFFKNGAGQPSMKSQKEITNPEDLKTLLKTVRKSISHLESKLNVLEMGYQEQQQEQQEEAPPPIPPKPKNIVVSRTQKYQQTRFSTYTPRPVNNQFSTTNTDNNFVKPITRNQTTGNTPRMPMKQVIDLKRELPVPFPLKQNNYLIKDRQIPTFVTPRTLLPTGRHIGKNNEYEKNNLNISENSDNYDINNNQYIPNDDDIQVDSTVWASYYDGQWYQAKVKFIQYHQDGSIYHVMYEGYGDTVYQLGRESIDPKFDKNREEKQRTIKDTLELERILNESNF